jgi:hypothetical protein
LSAMAGGAKAFLAKPLTSAKADAIVAILQGK